MTSYLNSVLIPAVGGLRARVSAQLSDHLSRPQVGERAGVHLPAATHLRPGCPPHPRQAGGLWRESLRAAIWHEGSRGHASIHSTGDHTA